MSSAPRDRTTVHLRPKVGLPPTSAVYAPLIVEPPAARPVDQNVGKHVFSVIGGNGRYRSSCGRSPLCYSVTMTSTTKLLRSAPLLGLAIVLGTLCPSANAAKVSSLAGQWKVLKTAFSNPDGVQAYSSDELRALVGSTLVISRESGMWIVPHGHAVLRESSGLQTDARGLLLNLYPRKPLI